MDKYQKSDQAVIIVSFARIDVKSFVIALGVGFAIASCIATIILHLQGYSTPLLHQFPGFEISWWGSLVAAFYFSLVGMVIGFILALFWNLTHIIYISLVVIRSAWWRQMAG